MKDEAKFKVIKCPPIRATQATKAFKNFIEYICSIGKGFELVKVTEEEPDGGIHFQLEIMGKGTEVDGRFIDRVMLWFTSELEQDDYVISVKGWEKIMEFYGKLKLDKTLVEKGWLIQKTVAVTGYNMEDDSPPSRFGFTFKYMPELQQELEKEAMVHKRANVKQQLFNDIADGIKNDDRIRVQLERFIKELK